MSAWVAPLESNGIDRARARSRAAGALFGLVLVSAVGCNSHTKLSAPPVASSGGARRVAYEQLRQLSLHETVYVNIGYGVPIATDQTTDYLQLANGARIDHVEDQLPVVPPVSPVAAAAKNIDTLEDVSAGVILRSLAVTAIGIGIRRLITQERTTAFETYERFLRKRLDLCERSDAITPCRIARVPARVNQGNLLLPEPSERADLGGYDARLEPSETFEPAEPAPHIQPAGAEPAGSATAALDDCRAAGAERCANEERFRALLSERLGREPFAADAPPLLSIILQKGADGLVARYRLFETSGAEQDQRTLRSWSGSCADLIEMVAAETAAVLAARPRDDWAL